MSDWLHLPKAGERLIKWRGPDEAVLLSNGGLLKVSKASLLNAVKAATLDLMRVSGSDLSELGNLGMTVGHGFVRMHATTSDGREWIGCAGIEVLATADPTGGRDKKL